MSKEEEILIEENVTLDKILSDPAFTKGHMIKQILNWNRIKNEAYADEKVNKLLNSSDFLFRVRKELDKGKALRFALTDTYKTLKQLDHE